MFRHGNVKHCLMKLLHLLLHLIIVLLHIKFYGTKARVKFIGSCLKQDKITYTHGKTVNIYIIYAFDNIFLDKILCLAQLD